MEHDVYYVLTPEMWTLVPAFFAVGAVAGVLAGLLGVGGGIVLVPGLLFVLQSLGYASDSLIHVCVGTSLALIIPNGLMSTYAHMKKGAVDMGLVKAIGAGVVIGVMAGTYIADILPGEALKMVFASAVLILAIIMISNPSRFKLMNALPAQPWPSVAGGVIGTISALIGIGGGTLSVPFLSLCNVAIHRAIGTAAALGVVIAVPGTIGFMITGLGEAGRPPFSVGYVNVLAWVLIMPVSLLFVRVGVWAAHKAPVPLMKRIFAVFLVIVAVKMWADIL